jgi:DNA-binding GntR family transcriptional regulator
MVVEKKTLAGPSMEESDGLVGGSNKVMGLGDRAYEDLKEKLVRGAYPPGHKITVRAVAEELGYGTTPARDALNRLVAERALVFSGPKTVVVPTLSLAELYEVTQMRLRLEGLAAEKGAIGAGAADIARLEALQGEIDAALAEGRYADALWSNKGFHFHIYGRANMPMLLATIETLWLRVGAAFNDLYPEFAISKYGIQNHRAALEGLRHKDPQEVKAAIETDIRDGYRRLRQALSDRAPKK